MGEPIGAVPNGQSHRRLLRVQTRGDTFNLLDANSGEHFRSGRRVQSLDLSGVPSGRTERDRRYVVPTGTSSEERVAPQQGDLSVALLSQPLRYALLRSIC